MVDVFVSKYAIISTYNYLNRLDSHEWTKQRCPKILLENIDSIWSSEVNAYLCKYLGMLLNLPLQQHYLPIPVMGFMSSHEVGEQN